MKETKKMLDFYKTRVKINSVGMVVAIIALIIIAVAILIAVPQIWWVSLIIFGLDIVFAIIFYFGVKAMRKKIKDMEKEISEADKAQSE